MVNSARTADLRPRRPGGLLVADECHRYGTDVNRHALRDRVPRGGWASAPRTPDPTTAHLAWLDPYFGARCFRMGYRRAIAEGVVAPFTSRSSACGSAARTRPTTTTWRARWPRAGPVSSRDRPRPPEPIGAFLGDVGPLRPRRRRTWPATAVGYLRAMAERRRLLAETPAKPRARPPRPRAVLAQASRAIVFTQSIEAQSRPPRCSPRGLGGRGAALRSRHATRAATGWPASEGAAATSCAPRSARRRGRRTRRRPRRHPGREPQPPADGAANGPGAAPQARRPAGPLRHRLCRPGPIEDPAAGAHEGFLDEVAPVAISVRSCPADAVFANYGRPPEHLVAGRGR